MTDNLTPGFAPPGLGSGGVGADTERYEIERLLGRGGFGEVYLARYRGRQGFTRRVALKVLRPEVAQQDDLARRVRDEARLLGLVHHRAVVGVDRLVQIQGRWCIVMEFVDGVSLDAVIRATATPVGVALEIVAEVCRALHVCGVAVGADGAPLNLLHRDIKPSNILLTRHGDVKLLDFGIAHAAFDGREAETRSLVFGTPGYMAPERFEMICGPPSDVYALGVVLYEVLTRKRFGRTSANPTRHEARVEESVRHLLEARADVPPELPELLRRILAAEPEERPTASALEREISGLVTGLRSPGLIRWAEHAVPSAVSVVTVEESPSTGAEADAAAWTGRVVTEDRSTLLSQPPEEPETRLVAEVVPARPVKRPGARWPWVGGGLALAGLALLAVARWPERPAAPGVKEEAGAVSGPTATEQAGTPATETTKTEPVPTPGDAPGADTDQPDGGDPTTSPPGPPPKPPTTKKASKTTCPPGQISLKGDSGAEGQGIEVLLEKGGWKKLPQCATWQRQFKVRRGETKDSPRGTVFTQEEDTKVITFFCDTDLCDAR